MRIVRIGVALIALCASATAEQSSYVLPTAPVPGANDLGSLTQNYYNPALRALASCSKGPVAPSNGPSSAPLPGQCWEDDSASPIVTNRVWDGTAWISRWTIDTSAHAFNVTSASVVNVQSGTSYAISDGDRGKLIDICNVSPVAISIAQAGTSGIFASGWNATIRNKCVGTITITPSTSLIDGDTSLSLRTGQSLRLHSDGVNYRTTLPQQPANANLWGLSSLSTAADKCVYWTGAGIPALIDCKSWFRSVMAAADVASGRGALGLTIGFDVQAYHANLAAWAGLTGASGKIGYFTGPGALSTFDSTSFGRSLSNAADAAALRSLAGLSNVVNLDTSTQANVSFTGLSAAAAAADADVLPVNQGSGNLKQTFGAIKTWIKGWIAKSDVGLGNVDNTSNATERAAARTLTNAVISAAANTISNLTTASFATNVIDVDTSLTANSDTRLATQKAVKAYVDAGGGGGSYPDEARRNLLLNSIYQSKLFVEYRRGVNLFATGFKGASDALNGILTGSSSNYTVTPGTAGATTGNVAPTSVSTVNGNFGQPNNSAISLATGGSSAFHGFRWTATVTGTIASVVFNVSGFTTGGNVTAKLYTNNSGNPGTQVGSSSSTVNITGTGNVTFNFPSPPSVTASTVYWIVIDGSGGGSLSVTLTTATTIAGYDSGRASTAVGVSPDNYSSSITIRLQINYTTVFSNMTLATVAQTADSSISNGRVLLEFDNTAAPALNTDLTVEVTCNGGTNWASATLSDVTAYSQGGRRVAETAATSCAASGTSFAARFKSFNSKNIPIHGASVTVNWLLRRDLDPAANDNAPMWLPNVA